jgi:SAM-dependent methyltransferase
VDSRKREYWEVRAHVPPGHLFVPPLSPSRDDIGILESRVQALAAEAPGRPVRALMLGVTRSIAEMRWPEGASLLALDWSPAMVRRWWVGASPARRRDVVLADWRALPLAAGSHDLAVSDGCYAALSSFDECRRVNAELRRALRPGGWFLQRCFVRPESPEPLDGLFAQLFDGRIRAFETFCWRLVMALDDGARIGASMGRAWEEWNARVPDRRPLLESRGWSEATIGMIERWRGSDLLLPIPTLAELRELIEPWFEMRSCSFADYEMGDRCARVALRARG